MPKGEESMQSYSGLQKLVALTIITLVALFIAAKFTHGDASGTAPAARQTPRHSQATAEQHSRRPIAR